MTTSSRPEAPPGLTVGGYTLLTRLGEGGMGVVHLAKRPGGDRVALKVLRPHIVGDDEARARLAREVGSLTRIRSEWVAEIVDADPWCEVPYVATRYVPGLSLHDQVQQEGALEVRDLRWLACCLAEGIASVHAVGVLHRDVKPSNVLMEGRTPILIDFGLARVADDPRLTHTGWLLGTPGYLAPEILHGDDATTASDVHSWGATVAYAGTGRPPFGRGPSMAIMDRVRRGQHDLTGLPDDLRDIVDAALAPDPSRRPTLPTLLDWLRGEPRERPVVAAAADGHDPHTLPLALAAGRPERTITLFEDEPEEPDEPDTWRVAEEYAAPPRASFLERSRRAMLLGSLALAAGAGVAAYPWVALLAMLLFTWLFRSASLAVSAAGYRRNLRGTRWYDPALMLFGAPWHAVRAIPGAVLLAVWALGLGLATALVCYAVAAGTGPTLFASGLVFAVSLWAGPGGSRVRSPLARMVNPLSAGPSLWVVATVLVLAGSSLLGYLVLTEGANWLPADWAPWSDLRVPWR